MKNYFEKTETLTSALSLSQNRMSKSNQNRTVRGIQFQDIANVNPIVFQVTKNVNIF